MEWNVHYPVKMNPPSIWTPLKEVQPNVTSFIKTDDNSCSEQQPESKSNDKKYELEQMYYRFICIFRRAPYNNFCYEDCETWLIGLLIGILVGSIILAVIITIWLKEKGKNLLSL